MASNITDSSVSRTHVVTAQRISRNWTLSTGLRYSLYSIEVDPTENTAFNIISFFCYGPLSSDSFDITDGFTEPLSSNARSFSL
jgi:hypothetical protein